MTLSPAQLQQKDADIDATRREQSRLHALDRYDLLDTRQEEAFDRITRLTRKIFQVPIVAISLIDAHRQWYKSCVGIGAPEVPRELTFCTHTIEGCHPLVVHDARSDPRFAENPHVTGDPHLRFYAGIPLESSAGHNIGTLCIADTHVRAFGPEELDMLVDLARLAMNEFELRMLASRDSLTGALTRRAFKEDARRAADLALRHRHDLSCIVADLDYFKRINDSHGHPVGDIVLKRTVAACLEQLRKTDLMGRLGGEEFAILLPNTGPPGAIGAAEKLRTAIERLEIKVGSETLTITASLGVASLDAATKDLDTLLRNADAALYKAKEAGRNRCAAWKPPVDESRKSRRRVLKAGQILFNDGMSSVDCTVRTLSEDGAELDVYSSLCLPRKFDLSIKVDNFTRHCQMIAQAEKHIEVEFA